MALATTSVADTEGDARPGWEAPSGAALTWITVGGLFLVAGGLVLLLTSAQQIAPGLFTGGATTSIGRLRPAGLVLLTFGGLGMVGSGVALDIARRLSRSPVQLELVAKAAGALMTLAVAVGAGSIVAGQSSGRTGLELRRIVTVPLAVALLLLAVVVIRTVATRERDEVHPALWFICAAVVAGPVVLLGGSLPRLAGVNDATVTAFATSGLLLLWLVPLGIGTACYVLPAACRAPLPSRRLAGVAFWGWLVFAPFAGPARLLSTPAQEWLETIGIAATIGLLVPLLAVVTLLLSAYARRNSQRHGADLRFALAGTGLLALAGPLLWLHSSRTAGDYLGASVSAQGLHELLLAGVAGAFLIAGAYHVLPALTGNYLSNGRVAGNQVWLHASGATLVALSLLVAGYVEGSLWAEGVRSGVPVFTGVGWQIVTDTIRPLLWLRVVGEALLAASWIGLFQQTFSTVAYGEPLAGDTP